MSKTANRKSFVTQTAKVQISADEVITDYRLAYQSRIASVLGRREVMSGKAKFGIFGDGKEVAQIAMAKTFQEGDWRSGYYRDQTFMLAAGMMTIRQLFGQLYADTDVAHDPASGGRQMGSHFATRFLDEKGNWKPQTSMKLTSADMSPTAGQMARLLGLAYASKLYRQNPALAKIAGDFSRDGNEIAFGTIGNASTSEGIFFEAVNAAGVLQVPLLMSVWDDGYGISVPNELQTIKSSISAMLAGIQKEEDTNGFEVYTVKGWDYLALCDTYALAADKVRKTHVPALIHVMEMTQPQGHSTSGSHERYKSKERMQFEEDFDCLKKMREWMVAEEIVTDEAIDQFESEDKKTVTADLKAAWSEYLDPIKTEHEQVLKVLKETSQETKGMLDEIVAELIDPLETNRKLIQSTLARAVALLKDAPSERKVEVEQLLSDHRKANDRRYNSFLYSESSESPLLVEEKAPTYSDSSETVDGRIVLTRCFDHHFKKDARIFVIGEDVGKMGDVNLVFEGLNAKYGDLRVTDTGIREATILGQGIGAALRGLRPIVDIQYLDYLLYALQGLSDDLATLHYRTAGGQKAPVIVRTKGHRLQGIWHTGSPMGMILHSCRGIYLAVPRNMTQAAGLYNTLLKGDNPAILIEVLNAYRQKERVPDNVGTFTVPLGKPEVLREGSDVTLVTYGACCRIALDAADFLEQLGIDLEVIDVQTLNPFDREAFITKSIRKTNSAIFMDEDVPGGASAFMLQQVIEGQGAWEWLDSAPRTISAKDNRSAYATDGEYFTKPNREDVIEVVYSIMTERKPGEFPPLN